MTAEQKARDMIERITGRPESQQLSSGDVAELANLINGAMPAPMTKDELRAIIERECGPVQRIGDMLWAVQVARAVERAYGIISN